MEGVDAGVVRGKVQRRPGQDVVGRGVEEHVLHDAPPGAGAGLLIICGPPARTFVTANGKLRLTVAAGKSRRGRSAGRRRSQVRRGRRDYDVGKQHVQRAPGSVQFRTGGDSPRPDRSRRPVDPVRFRDRR
ncbi:hypothetical protein GCM10020358_13240 [Amorphoplanes nipponensis]|uniref:Uncharacterized protein n=1 Tax=Actinoplanes nipponensis TaxID=135950 RepID=A0A919JPF1_9ACTN|nr:hypothetical protein Ani05nite_40780 [Actinoplanes nipponensis]